MADTRITILHLVNTLEFGGVYRHVTDLAEGLAESGIRSLIAGWAPVGSPLYDDARFVPLSLYSRDGRRKSLRGILTAPGAIRSVLRRARVDILHSHSRLAAMLASATLSIVPGVRHLHTVHTNFSNFRLFPFYPREVIAVSEGLAAAFRDRMRFARDSSIHVIHNGVELPRTHERVTCPTEFLFVGRLVAQKGVPLLLQTLEQCAVTEMTVRICGDGPLAEIVRKASTRGLPLQYEGFCDAPFERGEAPLALLFPSLDLEGSPYAVIDAFAHGIPVIAHDLPVLRGLVEHGMTGLIVPHSAPAVWGAMLRHALSHPDEMRAMGLRGKEAVAGQYRKDAMLKKTAAVYRRLLRK